MLIVNQAPVQLSKLYQSELDILGTVGPVSDTHGVNVSCDVIDSRGLIDRDGGWLRIHCCVDGMIKVLTSLLIVGDARE